MQNKKISLSLLFTILIVALFAQKGPARYNPQFKFDPPKRESVASADVTIALLKPVFIDKEIAKAGSPWDDFSTKMQTHVEEMLTAKGFKVRGPFNTRDEMVFNDKQKSNFTLQVGIELSVDIQRDWKTVIGLGGNSLKVKRGTVSISSSVVMTAVSNFSGEKLWKKSIQLTQKNFTYSGDAKWSFKEISFINEFREDNNLYNPIAKNLETIYAESLTVLWNQFDVDEMKGIAAEAKKEKAGEKQ